MRLRAYLCMYIYTAGGTAAAVNQSIIFRKNKEQLCGSETITRF